MFLKWYDTENVSTAKRLDTVDYNKAFTLDTKWLITEKIDGTNIAINFYPDGHYDLAKRSSTLGEGASFYAVFDNIHLLDRLIHFVREKFVWQEGIEQVTFHGEYFGPRVLNRIFYGGGYHFRFFALTFLENGERHFLPSYLTHAMFLTCGMEDLFVPVLGIVNTFEEALEFRNDGVTTFEDDKHHDVMEGIVISPYDLPAVSEEGNFLFKSKSDAFVEKAPAKKVRLTDDGVIETRKHVNKEFLNYCTESRMYSVFSKLGKPESVKQAGPYLAAFIEDAKKDFLKEHPEYEALGKGELRSVTNIGSLGFNLFCLVMGKLRTDS